MIDTEHRYEILRADCFKMLKKRADESVDMIITSPPYCMKKAYESPDDDIETFRSLHERLLPELYRVLKPNGSICWQVGYHISTSCIVPLDFIVYDIFTRKTKDFKLPLILRNRIIWTFGHGLNADSRFSGRHETLLWFTKGGVKHFDLNAVRIPQKYPGKRAYKGPNKGKFTGNPLGKNPSDVWDIPNVKANHVEKTDHPCQFPVAIPSRLIKALTTEDAIVMDPFMGAGTTGVAAVDLKRAFVGTEIKSEYYKIAKKRIKDACSGRAKIRPDVPVMEVNMNTAVATLPEEFKKVREEK